MKRKIFVGFACGTSAWLPKFFCPLFRHCAVVMDGFFIQIGTDGARLFRAGPREIKKLENAGWVFVECETAAAPNNPAALRMPQFLTCVGFAKRALGIRKALIWTPDQLYRLVMSYEV